MSLVGGIDSENPDIVPGCIVKLKGLVNNPELNDHEGVVLGFDANRGRFTVYTRRFAFDITGNKKINVRPDNLVVDTQKPACPMFTTKICPTLGRDFDLPFGISVDVSESVCIGPMSEFVSGPCPFIEKEFAAPGATLNHISVSVGLGVYLSSPIDHASDPCDELQCAMRAGELCRAAITRQAQLRRVQ